ncbi:uncharacterized protein [Physcomitrium patens]|uniref:uncharacterized protein n=1 Tax=Physcomitrium patens TaxID=3218 RepID=UPI003CCCEE1F
MHANGEEPFCFSPSWLNSCRSGRPDAHSLSKISIGSLAEGNVCEQARSSPGAHNLADSKSLKVQSCNELVLVTAAVAA